MKHAHHSTSYGSSPIAIRDVLLSHVHLVLSGADKSTELTRSTNGRLEEGAQYASSTALCIVVSMILYVAAFATGLGNIPWQQGELFRLEVRGLGSSICTAVNWYVILIASLAEECQVM